MSTVTTAASRRLITVLGALLFACLTVTPAHAMDENWVCMQSHQVGKQTVCDLWWDTSGPADPPKSSEPGGLETPDVCASMTGLAGRLRTRIAAVSAELSAAQAALPGLLNRLTAAQLNDSATAQALASAKATAQQAQAAFVDRYGDEVLEVERFGKTLYIANPRLTSSPEGRALTQARAALSAATGNRTAAATTLTTLTAEVAATRATIAQDQPTLTTLQAQLARVTKALKTGCP